MDGNAFVVVHYLRVNLLINLDDGDSGPRIEARNGSSGPARMWLTDVPKWLEANPGTLIVSIRPV